MIYAYDLWALMPVRDLYDSLIMAMAINTAKDIYDRGQLELKDFRKEYGNFMSPFKSDMDWYNDNFNISREIEKIYARGGDPLRNSADRGELYRWINSRPYGEYNQKVLAINDVAEYKKSRDALIKAGMWNPEYERLTLGGLLLEEWDGSLGNWTATSASPYLDYEKKYGHLFDKMGFEYDEDESKKHPGMYAMTKNKSRMRDILSSSIPDLRNDPQYQYDLKRTYSDIVKNNPDMSYADAMKHAQKLLENEIIERNYKGGMLLIEDPIAKEERAYKNQVALENLRYTHLKNLLNDPDKNTKHPLGMKSGILAEGINILSGTTDVRLQGRQMKPNIRNIFNSAYATAGLDIVPDKKGTFLLPIYNTNNFGISDTRYPVFKRNVLSKLTHYAEPKDFPRHMGLQPMEGKELYGVVQLVRDNILDLYTDDDIITHSYGYSGRVTGSRKMRSDISTNIEAGHNYEVIPSREVITTMNRDTGKIETYRRVHLKPDNKDLSVYNVYIKDISLSTGENKTAGRDPVTNMDIDERVMNLARSRSIALDKEYGASMNTMVEFPVTGAWTGVPGNIDYTNQITDEYFYPTTK